MEGKISQKELKNLRRIKSSSLDNINKMEIKAGNH